MAASVCPTGRAHRVVDIHLVRVADDAHHRSLAQFLLRCDLAKKAVPMMRVRFGVEFLLRVVRLDLDDLGVKGGDDLRGLSGPG